MSSQPYTRRSFLKGCATVGAGGFVVSNRAMELAIGPKRPNFIYFLADDMGWNDAGYQGGVRVPAVISWPGKLNAGAVIDEPLHIVDVYPTFVKLARGSLEQPLPLDGKDAWPTIAKGKSTPHEEIIYGLGAIRRGDFKLIEADVEYYGWKSEVTRLYNIRQDSIEQNNLADAMPDKVEELRARLAYHAAQARPSPDRPTIPDYPPKVFGEGEKEFL